MNPPTPNSQIAVIGAGAAGLTAAWLLQRNHTVTLFESRDRLGGHVWTFDIPYGPDRGVPLDLGFMVFNDRNYPTLHRLFAALNLDDFGASEMSFSTWDRVNRVGYALNWDPRTPFAKRFNLSGSGPDEGRLPTSLFKEMLKFGRHTLRQLEDGSLAGLTIDEWADQGGWSNDLLERYIVPMGAAIWSSPAKPVRDFPADWFFHFFRNHGLLELEEGPQWFHVRGGARRYVDAISRDFSGKIRLGTPVRQIHRTAQSVQVDAGQGLERFDQVVLATHADITLSLLSDADEAERAALSSWKYFQNRCVVHSDERSMPPQSMWASWNCIREPDGSLAQVYHLNRLQDHGDTARQYFLTMNGKTPIDPATVLLDTELSHPGYTRASLDAQTALRACGGTRRTWFCGAHMTYGFHEDAIASGAQVAAALGCPL